MYPCVGLCYDEAPLWKCKAGLKFCGRSTVPVTRCPELFPYTSDIIKIMKSHWFIKWFIIFQKFFITRVNCLIWYVTVHVHVQINSQVIHKRLERYYNLLIHSWLLQSNAINNLVLSLPYDEQWIMTTFCSIYDTLHNQSIQTLFILQGLLRQRQTKSCRSEKCRLKNYWKGSLT